MCKFYLNYASDSYLCFYLSSFPSWKGYFFCYLKVEGMQAGITLRIENHDGILKLIVVDCGSVIENIFISLDGGASWFYQGYAP